MSRGSASRPSEASGGGAPPILIEVAGRLASGAEVLECRLRNRHGTEARILTLGATLRTLSVADARGVFEDVVLGFDTVEQYLHGRDYFGATIGRYANRIAHGRFAIAGRSYQLPLNDGANCEHGGEEGFDRRLWSMVRTAETDGPAVTLALVSADNDQGFPGELHVQLSYILTHANELRLEYEATCSAVTPINLTNHSYWNLSGAAHGDALEARLTAHADAYTPIDADHIPTGELRAVAGTAFDFRTPHVIASRLRDGREPQLLIGRGYDHNFVLNGEPGVLREAARLEDPRSGRILELSTTEPGLQLYSGNFLTGAVLGKGRRLYRQGDGVALETQHFPDAPNHAHFPSTLLEPGRVWRSSTVYRFATCTGDVALRHREVGYA